MELRQLEAFVEAAQRGSISGAAKRLFLTQPSLTQRVRALEQELGQELLVRTRRGVRLTTAGQLFLPRAEAALASLRRATNELKDLREVQAGTLRLAAAADIAGYILPAVLSRFHERYPGVEILLFSGRSLPAAALLLSDEAELALIHRPAPFADHTGQLLYQERLYPVAARAHPLATQPVVAPEAFAAAGLIVNAPDDELYDLTIGFFGARALSPRIVARVDGTATAKRLVVAGLGVALLPERVVGEELARGDLALLDLGRIIIPMRGIWAIRRSESQPSSAVRALLELLDEDLSPPKLGARPRSRRTPDGDGPAATDGGADPAAPLPPAATARPEIDA